MQDKRAALVALIQATLDAHGTDPWTVEHRFRKDPLSGLISANDIKAIMGDPIRYCRLAYVGASDAADSDLSISFDVAQARQVFAVYLWMQYEDASTYASSSQALFDAATENDPGGLMPTLRERNYLTAGGQTVYLLNPSDYIVLPEPVHMADTDYRAHFASFFITVL